MNDIANFIISELKPYEKYGIITQENGTKLIGKAPHIAPMAWLHYIFKGLELSEIKITESELNTEIPKDYIKFMTFSNGLELFNGTLSLFGKRTSYNRTAEVNARQPFELGTVNIYEKPSNSNESYFYIGSYNCDGSLILIDKSNNKVHRCDKDEAKILNSWTDFSEFLKTEIIRLKSLHNENGTKKKPNENTIPKKESQSNNNGTFWEKLMIKLNLK